MSRYDNEQVHDVIQAVPLPFRHAFETTHNALVDHLELACFGLADTRAADVL